MFGSALRATLPVAFGYIPLGIAFGILLGDLGYDWWWSPVMGLLIYAGSAQFLAVTLLASGAGVLDAFVATLLLNLRHLFYGLTVLDRYRALGPRGVYAIFGLTDETFSLLAGGPSRPDDRSYVLAVTAINQAWWVGGCVLGSWLGGALPFSTEGLAFSLTALFAVLLVEQLRRGIWVEALAGAGAAALICGLVLPSHLFLVGSIGLSALFLVVLPARSVS